MCHLYKILTPSFCFHRFEDDYYAEEYSRRPDMDYGGVGGRRRPPPPAPAPKKKEEEVSDASDAFILAEFEKRFGKRIKLGDDSNTLVLSTGGKSQVGC